jgi:hypothetical protein
MGVAQLASRMAHLYAMMIHGVNKILILVLSGTVRICLQNSDWHLCSKSSGGGGETDPLHGLRGVPGTADSVLVLRRHEPPARERRPIVVGAPPRALRDCRLLRRQLLVGDQAEQVTDAAEQLS